MEITAALITVAVIMGLLQCAVSDQMRVSTQDTDPIGGFSSTFQRLKLDVDTILIQRTSFGVTTYHLLDDPRGHALFTRPRHDSGRKFIFFNNPSFPPGSGHYFVLKKMESQGKIGYDQEKHGNQRLPLYLYETFSLHFKDSLHGTVTDLDPFLYSFMQNRVGLRDPYRNADKWKSGRG